jgi:hypothetical protein
LDDLRGSKLHINELANALEVLTNLSYMMRVEVGNPRQILLYLSLFDSQILNLAELVKSEKAAMEKTGRVLPFGVKFSATPSAG